MAFLSRYLAQIRAQLQGLSVSHRLLIGLLVVILVVTIFFVVEASRKPEMVDLLPQSLTAEEISTITSYLKGKYQYQVQADKILVPVEQAYQVRGELAAAQALPHDTTAAFARLAEQSFSFDTTANTDQKWVVAKGEVLGRILRAYPFIADATVIIDKKAPGFAIGRAEEKTSATVWIKLKSNEVMNSSRVQAITNLVRGAVAGLEPDRIQLTDGTRSYRAANDDAAMPADLLEFKQSQEEKYTKKLDAIFSHMGDVKIAVNVVPDMSARTIRKETFDPKGIAKVEIDATSKESSSGDGASAGGQPGVQPNVSVATGGSGGGGGSGNTTSESSSKTEARFSSEQETQMVPAGTVIADITATINVPRSFFRSLYRRNAKDEKVEPTDEQLQPLFDTYLKRLHAQAKNAIGAKTDDQIRLDWFDDTLVPLMEAGKPVGSVAGLGGGGIGSLAMQHVKEVVLATFTVGALTVMLMMVRRAAPAPAGADADLGVFFGAGGGGKGKGSKGSRRTGDPGALDVGEDVIGEAGQGEAVLTGIELDDETLQSRKMVDEVSTMIKENPENAASLVKRWITKGK